jgi:hypothetical protein
MTVPPPYETPGDPAVEFQGDVHAADIVGPTGEEMPIATHAEVHRMPEPPALEAPPHRAGPRD